LNAWAGTKGDPDQWSMDWKQRCERKQPFVNTREGRVMGFMELDADGHIDCTFVDPAYAGCGIMMELMAAVKEEAALKELPKLFAEVSLTAKRFFERSGFVVIQETMAKIGDVELPNFIMECRLHPEAISLPKAGG